METHDREDLLDWVKARIDRHPEVSREATRTAVAKLENIDTLLPDQAGELVGDELSDAPTDLNRSDRALAHLIVVGSAGVATVTGSQDAILLRLTETISDLQREVADLRQQVRRDKA